MNILKVKDWLQSRQAQFEINWEWEITAHKIVSVKRLKDNLEFSLGSCSHYGYLYNITEFHPDLIHVSIQQWNNSKGIPVSIQLGLAYKKMPDKMIPINELVNFFPELTENTT